MAIKLISLVCPECNAKLENIDGEREFVFCSYCGTKILINNENEYIYRSIDEAEIKKAETDRIISLKELEADNKTNRLKVIVSIVLGIVALVSLITSSEMGFLIGMISICAIMYIWLLGDNSGRRASRAGKIKAPSGAIPYEDKNYKVMEEILRDAGFTKIKSMPMNDLTTGFFKKPSMVDSVTIGGEKLDNIKWYDPNDQVIISYHSFAEK